MTVAAVPRPNFRTTLGFAGGYESINREERNLTAILYHLLMDPQNLAKMMTLLGSQQARSADDSGIFFEYAFVRDLWATQVRDEGTARKCIAQFLSPPEDANLNGRNIREINEFFGVGGRPSTTEIQMPARWSISKFKNTIIDREFFVRVCKFKWAFNAKPDIVIHTTHDTAICIEAKLESDESLYPSAQADREEFRRRGLQLVTQTELQKFMLEELLGITTEFVLLVQNVKAHSATHRTVSWHQVFSVMDCASSPAFIKRWLAPYVTREIG